MTRPLMPGSEPVQLKYAQPKAPAQRLDAPPPTIPGLDCTCSVCTSARARVEYESMRPTWAGTYRSNSWVLAARPEGPAHYPVGKPPGLIRGVYDFPTNSYDTNLSGSVRWLDPSTGEVYDSGGNRQWEFVATGDPDLWVDEHRPSYKWRALPVIATTPPIYFDWVL